MDVALEYNLEEFAEQVAISYIYIIAPATLLGPGTSIACSITESKRGESSHMSGDLGRCGLAIDPGFGPFA